MNSFFRRLGWLTRRRRKEDELREELEFHLNEETEQRASEGLATDEAKWAARRELGNTALVRENTRAAWGWTGLGELAQDVRFGVRVLRKSPGYSLVALFSLALGIGASTAMFSVVYGVLIAPYPYGHPNEIWAPLISDLKNPQQRGFSMHPMRDFVEIKKLPAWSEVMATRPENRLLTGDRDPENFTAVSVTANTFQFIEVPPILGRSIQPYDLGSDGQPARVIVLSYKHGSGSLPAALRRLDKRSLSTSSHLQLLASCRHVSDGGRTMVDGSCCLRILAIRVQWPQSCA